MAKASFAFKDFSKGGFGLQGGRYEVEAARVLVVQPQVSRTGEQANPFTAIEIDVVPLGDDWKRTSEDILQHQFAVAFTNDDQGTLKLRARPGVAKDANDESPKDATAGKDSPQEMVGIEGNCVVVDDGYKPWAQSPWGLFIESLESKGFKPEVNAQGLTGNYVGMKFSCEVKELPKPRNWKKEQPPTALLATGINTYPWDVKKSAGQAKGSGSQAQASGAAAGASGGSNTAAAGTDGATNGALDAVFNEAAASFVKKHKGKKMSRDEFRKQLGMDLMAVKAIGIKGAPLLVKAHVTNNDGLIALGMSHGFDVDTENWEITL